MYKITVWPVDRVEFTEELVSSTRQQHVCLRSAYVEELCFSVIHSCVRTVNFRFISLLNA